MLLVRAGRGGGEGGEWGAGRRGAALSDGLVHPGRREKEGVGVGGLQSCCALMGWHAQGYGGMGQGGGDGLGLSGVLGLRRGAYGWVGFHADAPRPTQS